MCVLSHSIVSDTLWPHRLQPSRLLCQWGFPRQEYWSGFHTLLPGIFPIQEDPLCRWILYRLSHQGSPRILEWVAYPGVSSLSLLQRIFLAQDLNQGSPALQADSLPAWATWEAPSFLNKVPLFLNFHKLFKNLCMNQHFASLCENSTASL